MVSEFELEDYNFSCLYIDDVLMLKTVENSCGETTRQNGSYFVKPNVIVGGHSLASQSVGVTCQLTVEKSHPSVSQLRLDFIQFEVQ